MSERPSEGFEPFPSPLGEGRRSGRGFRLINQTVMTRAEAPTIDSWVHLAQTLRPPLWGTLFFVLATLGAASAAVFAALRLFGVVRLADEPASDGGLLLGMIAMTAIAVGCGWVVRLMVWRWVRNGTVGARPSGVALGAHGVAVRVPGRDVEIPWTEIRGIAPRVRRIGSGMGERELPIIEIARDPDAPVADRVQLIVASGGSRGGGATRSVGSRRARAGPTRCDRVERPPAWRHLGKLPQVGDEARVAGLCRVRRGSFMRFVGYRPKRVDGVGRVHPRPAQPARSQSPSAASRPVP